MALEKLSPEEMRNFLNRTDPALVGVVGTLGADGFPHLVPVWFRWDDERIHIWTLAARAWVRNAARDDRVAFSVQEDQVSNFGVTLKGRARIVTSDGPWVTDQIWAITRRYIAAEPEAKTYIDRWLHLRTIVSITPEKIHAWREA